MGIFAKKKPGARPAALLRVFSPVIPVGACQGGFAGRAAGV